MTIDPAKSAVKFDYGTQDAVLKKITVNKYKKDKGDLIESVEAVLTSNA